MLPEHLHMEAFKGWIIQQTHSDWPHNIPHCDHRRHCQNGDVVLGFGEQDPKYQFPNLWKPLLMSSDLCTGFAPIYTFKASYEKCATLSGRYATSCVDLKKKILLLASEEGCRKLLLIRAAHGLDSCYVVEMG